MDFRQGTCSACKNSFRVPATFTAEKAKCPKCGGVVEIGPVQAAGSAGAPSASVAPPPAPAVSAPPVPAKAPAPKPAAPKPVATSEPRPAPKVAAPAPAPVAKPSVRAATVAAKERVRAKGVQSSETAETTRGGRPRRDAPNKRSPVPMIVGGLVVVAVLAVVMMKVLGGGDEKVAAPRVEAPAAKPDLSHIADAEQLPETTPDVAAQFDEHMKTYMTATDSKLAERSGDILVSSGLKSVPSILNGFKKLDYTNSKGADLGWKIANMLLKGRCEGTDFGWKRDTRPEDVAFNTRVIERWFQAWQEAKGDKEKWVAISQRAAAEAAAAKPPAK